MLLTERLTRSHAVIGGSKHAFAVVRVQAFAPLVVGGPLRRRESQHGLDLRSGVRLDALRARAHVPDVDGGRDLLDEAAESLLGAPQLVLGSPSVADLER